MILNKNPSRRDLVIFGAALPVFFALIGLVLAHRLGAPPLSWFVWGAGALLTAVYFGFSPVRRPIFVGWAYLVYPIGWTISHLLLLVIYWLVVTPIALLLRLLRHDPLARSFEPSASSYWAVREKTTQVKRYFQQF